MRFLLIIVFASTFLVGCFNGEQVESRKSDYLGTLNIHDSSIRALVLLRGYECQPCRIKVDEMARENGSSILYVSCNSSEVEGLLKQGFQAAFDSKCMMQSLPNAMPQTQVLFLSGGERNMFLLNGEEIDDIIARLERELSIR